MNATELQSLLSDHQGGHSVAQMNWFITSRSGGTLYGMYKQALRELHKRYRGLQSLYMQRRDHRDTQRQMFAFDWHARSDEITRSILDAEREFAHFYAQARALKKKVGNLTPERRHSLDCEMWLHKAKTMAAVDLLTVGRITPPTIEFIASLPMTMRRQLWKTLETPLARTSLVSWFKRYEPPALPSVQALTNGEVRGLLMEADNNG